MVVHGDDTAGLNLEAAQAEEVIVQANLLLGQVDRAQALVGHPGRGGCRVVLECE